jgi:hypothetical protein
VGPTRQWLLQPPAISLLPCSLSPGRAKPGPVWRRQTRAGSSLGRREERRPRTSSSDLVSVLLVPPPLGPCPRTAGPHPRARRAAAPLTSCQILSPHRRTSSLCSSCCWILRGRMENKGHRGRGHRRRQPALPLRSPATCWRPRPAPSPAANACRRGPPCSRHWDRPRTPTCRDCTACPYRRRGRGPPGPSRAELRRMPLQAQVARLPPRAPALA